MLNSKLILLALLASPALIAFAQQDEKSPLRARALPQLPPLGQVVGLPGQGVGSVASPSLHVTPSQPVIYRQTMSDGSVVYSDKILSGARSHAKLDNSGQAGGISTYSAPIATTSRITATSADVEEIRITPASSVSSQLLDEALRKQREAAVITAADRSFSRRKNNAGGNQSRLSEAYFKRQRDAEEMVKLAREAVAGAD